jgi:polysaccharide pyruvyl transferase WcaK-like protein
MTSLAPRRVLLQGYYGYANLGDDLLLLVAYRMLRETFPGASIHVRCLSPRGAYLRALLGEHVPLVSSLEPTDFDLIVAGGGGVFFDFDEGPAALGWLNRAARAVPAPWLAAARRGYRKLKGTLGADAPRRVGVGIGVGTFTERSARFLVAKATLGEMSLLVVRDEESRENALRVAPGLPVQVGADLVFARRYWCPGPPPEGERRRRSVAFVLRAWKHDRLAHLPAVAEAAARLQGGGVEVSLVLFDPEDEAAVRPAFPGVPTLVWQPEEPGNLERLLGHLGTRGVVVSTRAHGAIAAGCLGVPSICLAIEPKLRVVAGMFRSSGLALGLEDGLTGRLEEAVLGRLERGEELRREVEEDVRRNERIAGETPGLLRGVIEGRAR